jgi:hypothetical protein
VEGDGGSGVREVGGDKGNVLEVSTNWNESVCTVGCTLAGDR